MQEYIIINKTTIQQRIENLLKNNYRAFSEHVELDLLREILSQSTPLIPENIKLLQELVDEGYDPYDSAHHLQVQRMLKVIENHISNLKLDI